MPILPKRDQLQLLKQWESHVLPQNQLSHSLTQPKPKVTTTN